MKICRRLYRFSPSLFEARPAQNCAYNVRPSLFTKYRIKNLRSIHLIPTARHLSRSSNSPSLIKTNEQTIYALSTAPGRAAIAIIRISGPACLDVYSALCPGKSSPRARQATLRTLYEPWKPPIDTSVLDANALVLYFPAPKTATGEDVLEFHVHGGAAVVKAVLAAIPKTIPEDIAQSIRYAEPGEFTRRAFYNDRLDLLQIEALSDTLSADTEQQRRLAVRGSTSTQANRYEVWREQLLEARGELEALIDFSEDQHFDESPAQLCASVAEQVQNLKTQLQANIENASRGELLRNGISVALIGAPNAGKSSLLNQIVGREAAIVSSEPGTTRDVVDVNVDIGGFYCRFGDLAGIRSKPGSPGAAEIGDIEKEGVRRAKERALASDVVIAVFPAVIHKRPAGQEINVEIAPEILEVLEQCDSGNQRVICVLNKADLFPNQLYLRSRRREFWRHSILRTRINQDGGEEKVVHAISCKNAQNIQGKSDPGGIRAFLDGALIPLFSRMTSAVIPGDQKPIGSNSDWTESLGATERQRILLQQCLEHLESFLAEVQWSGRFGSDADHGQEDIDIVLAAESLRSAADCLSKITGKGEAGDVEEVLGVVFEKYEFSGTLIVMAWK